MIFFKTVHHIGIEWSKGEEGSVLEGRKWWYGSIHSPKINGECEIFTNKESFIELIKDMIRFAIKNKL